MHKTCLISQVHNYRGILHQDESHLTKLIVRWDLDFPVDTRMSCSRWGVGILDFWRGLPIWPFKGQPHCRGICQAILPCNIWRGTSILGGTSPASWAYVGVEHLLIWSAFGVILSFLIKHVHSQIALSSSHVESKKSNVFSCCPIFSCPLYSQLAAFVGTHFFSWLLLRELIKSAVHTQTNLLIQ